MEEGCERALEGLRTSWGSQFSARSPKGLRHEQVDRLMDVPDGYCLRPMDQGDYGKGLVPLLEQLTQVDELSEQRFQEVLALRQVRRRFGTSATRVFHRFVGDFPLRRATVIDAWWWSTWSPSSWWVPPPCWSRRSSSTVVPKWATSRCGFRGGFNRVFVGF